MRSLILQQLVTVDGFVAGPSGELDFATQGLDWSDVDADSIESGAHVETILLGANTYRMFVSYWPTATEPMADLVNTKEKVVVSSTLGAAPWGEFEPARVVGGLDEVAALKEQEGGEIICFGSIELSHQLLREGLVDEIQLRICPAVLGEGRHLLPPDYGLASLEFIEATVYEAGIVATRYLVTR